MGSDHITIIDLELNSTSTNPVAAKAIYEGLQRKFDKADPFPAFTGTPTVPTPIVGPFNTSFYSDYRIVNLEFMEQYISDQARYFGNYESNVDNFITDLTNWRNGIEESNMLSDIAEFKAWKDSLVDIASKEY